MATCHVPSKSHTKALVTDIGKWLGKHVKPAEQGHRLGESFEVWYLPITSDTQQLKAPLSSQCKDTRQLHHQIYRNGKVSYFAISARNSDARHPPKVTGLLVSERMNHIYEGARWLDSVVTENDMARLLHVPSLAILAFWLMSPVGSRFLILDGSASLVGTTGERNLLSEEGFAMALQGKT